MKYGSINLIGSWNIQNWDDQEYLEIRLLPVVNNGVRTLELQQLID